MDGCLKLRLPTEIEVNACFINFTNEIEKCNPNIIVLLGKTSIRAIQSHMDVKFKKWEKNYLYSYDIKDGIYYIGVHHPSYIHVYKRSDIGIYEDNISGLINSIIKWKKEDGRDS